MILDAQLLFSDAQAVTAAAGSTNVIDTGPLFGSNLGRNLGIGERTWIYMSVDVAMTDAGSDSTLAVTLETDADVAFGSPATVATLFTFAAVSPIGTAMYAAMPVASDAVPYERYIRLKFTPASGNLSTGSFTAGITKDISAWVSTFGGFVTGV
jgi:hypothetical protein